MNLTFQAIYKTHQARCNGLICQIRSNPFKIICISRDHNLSFCPTSWQPFIGLLTWDMYFQYIFCHLHRLNKQIQNI